MTTQRTSTTTTIDWRTAEPRWADESQRSTFFEANYTPIVTALCALGGLASLLSIAFS